MRISFICCLLPFCWMFFSCADSKQVKPVPEQITGNWLVLYPDHSSLTRAHRNVYNREVQDSIIALMGLKLLSFKADGSFLQADSLFANPGQWMAAPDSQVLIDGAGKGLDQFTGKILSIENDTLRILEQVTIDNQKLPLVWHLKRITEKDRQPLFDSASNSWRFRSGKPETEQQLRARVKAMLEYYSIYFTMVAKESAFFSQTKVPLPFQYYQHSIGLKALNPPSAFYHFFHDDNDAQKAHSIIAGAMENNKKRFPSGANFVVEYAEYMKDLAETL